MRDTIEAFKAEIQTFFDDVVSIGGDITVVDSYALIKNPSFSVYDDLSNERSIIAAFPLDTLRIVCAKPLTTGSGWRWQLFFRSPWWTEGEDRSSHTLDVVEYRRRYAFDNADMVRPYMMDGVCENGKAFFIMGYPKHTPGDDESAAVDYVRRWRRFVAETPGKQAEYEQRNSEYIKFITDEAERYYARKP